MKSASIVALAIVSLLGVSAVVTFGPASYAAGAATSTSNCVPSADPFVVTGAGWGTQSEPMSAGPGGIAVPMTATLLYTGGCAITAASFELKLAQPFTTPDGSNATTTFEVSVGNDAVLAETYHLDIATDAALATYTFSLYVGYNTTDYSGIFFQSVNFTLSLKGTPKLGFAGGPTALAPGKVNDLAISIANTGSGTASSISTTIGSSSQVGILSQIPFIQTLAPGSMVNESVKVFVPQALSGSAVTLSITSSYYDPYSFEETTSGSLGFSVPESPPDSLSMSLVQLNDTSTVGGQARLAFILTNSGGSAIYSPVFSVVASSPVVVTGSAAVNYQQALQPGQTIEYYVTVGSSPSSTAGIYGGTATLTYSDIGGVQHSQAFPVGFVLKGSIEFVFQDVAFSQTATAVTITGSLLNEGNANAYYAQVSGRVGNAPPQNSSAYVGEIDPNTPNPFTVTVSLPAPGRAQQNVPVVLTVTYRDSFGKVSNFTSSRSTNLESAEQLALGSATTTSGSGSSGGGLVTIVSYSVVALIVVVVAGAAIFVRKKRVSATPPKEDKVI